MSYRHVRLEIKYGWDSSLKLGGNITLWSLLSIPVLNWLLLGMIASTLQGISRICWVFWIHGLIDYLHLDRLTT